MLKLTYKSAFFAFVLTIASCSTSGGTADMGTETENKSIGTPNLTLEDHLRRLTGVIVTGSGDNINVKIRGSLSITNANEQPLYILNGKKIGRSYARVVSYIAKGSIISVEAVPAAQASFYGLEGGAGVIIIKTK